MGYAIDADRILKDRQIHAAANFCVDCFDDMADTLGIMLNRRSLIARKLIESRYECAGKEDPNIESFDMINSEIIKLLGI